MFNATTGRWSSATLSQPRQRLAATSVGSKALFAGGGDPLHPCVDAVDVYDSSTGEWSTAANLSIPRCDLAATTLGGRAIFAGGQHLGFAADDAVDLYDDDALAPQLSCGIDAATARAVTITVRNTGDAALAPYSVSVYGARRTGRSILLGNMDVPKSLHAGAAGELTVPLSIPAGSALADYDLFITDGTGRGARTIAAQVDMAPPSAQVASAPILRSTTRAYTFSVSYHDRHRIDAASLDDQDLVVTGPDGFRGRAELVSFFPGKHPSTLVARYALYSPDGRWRRSDDGEYVVHLQAGEVMDSFGNGPAARPLGSFTVSIPTLTTVPAVAASPTHDGSQSNALDELFF
jgi:hypothetical protein